jgi:hypothetical protein
MKRKVRQNAWGNWRGYEGSRFAHDFGTNEQEAKRWAGGADISKFEPSVFKNRIGKKRTP